MGARFSAAVVHYVFSRRPPPASVPAGVHFVTESIGAFAERLRTQAGKNVWMMGGGENIGSILDEDAIDKFIITLVPTFIGEGIPLLAPRHRAVVPRLLGVQQFPDGVVQLRYRGSSGNRVGRRFASSLGTRRIWLRGSRHARFG
jgi:dihydrofolate reductase